LTVINTDDIQSFEDSIFCIYLQRQYSAARELEEFEESLLINGDKNAISNVKFLSALKVISFIILRYYKFIY
jgi:hypothetical protein